MLRVRVHPVLLAILALCASGALRADGVVIDKIYHPYVDALEQELEYRLLSPDRQSDQQSPAQLHQMSLGTAVGAHVFTELYLVGARSREGSFSVTSYEAELKWQLSEQGEYAADWGLLFEYENARKRAEEEFTVALLVEKEWGRWSGTGNLQLIYEWGSAIDPEFETVLALQTRYRYSPRFEPALEFYAGQNTRGLGPVVQGMFKTGIRRTLHWEAGVIFGLDSASPEQTWRLLLEYEF